MKKIWKNGRTLPCPDIDKHQPSLFIYKRNLSIVTISIVTLEQCSAVSWLCGREITKMFKRYLGRVDKQALFKNSVKCED